MPVIGKTGTAQNGVRSRTRRGSPRSPTPTHDPAAPQYVIVAMVEQGGFGASTRRADRAPGHRLPEQPERRAPAGRASRPRRRASSRATDVDDQPEPHRPRHASRRGLGEPSRLEASPLRHFDWLLVGASLAHHRARAADDLLDAPTSASRATRYYFVKRQALFAAIGIAAMVVVMLHRLPRCRDYSMLVLRRHGRSCCWRCSRRSARTSRATRRGSSCPGGFTLQPSELAKFGIIVALAGYCNQYRGELDAWRLTVIIGLAAVPIGLVLLQPDLGTVHGARASSSWRCSRWPA